MSIVSKCLAKTSSELLSCAEQWQKSQQHMEGVQASPNHGPSLAGWCWTPGWAAAGVVRVATAANGAHSRSLLQSEPSLVAELLSTKPLPRAHHCPRVVRTIWQGQLRLCLGFACVTQHCWLPVSQSSLNTDLQYHSHIRGFSLCSSHLLTWHWNSSQIYPLLNLGKPPQNPQIDSLLCSPYHIPASLDQKFHVLFHSTRLIKTVLITVPGLLLPPLLTGYSTEYRPSCVLNHVIPFR